MKGLFLKDGYLLLRHYKFVLPFCLLFLALSAFSGTSSVIFLAYPCTIVSVLPYSFFAYDEKDGWLTYCAALPVTRGACVAEKYLLTPLALGVVVVLPAALLDLLAGGADGTAAWRVLPAVAQAGLYCLLLPAVLLPFVIRFGTEKGRVLYYILLGGFMAGFFLLGDSGTEARGADLLPAGLPVLPLAAGVAALYLLSWAVSTALYRRREL